MRRPICREWELDGDGRREGIVNGRRYDIVRFLKINLLISLRSSNFVSHFVILCGAIFRLNGSHNLYQNNYYAI